MALSIWNVTPVVCIAATSWAGRLASGLAGIVDVIDIPDVIHSFDHKKNKFYFTVNQLQIEKSLKLTQTF